MGVWSALESTKFDFGAGDIPIPPSDYDHFIFDDEFRDPQKTLFTSEISCLGGSGTGLGLLGRFSILQIPNLINFFGRCPPFLTQSLQDAIIPRLVCDEAN